MCLGILFDTMNRTRSIPPEKLQEIITLCNNMQSLLGSLLYVSKCVKPVTFFLNHMLQVLRDQVSSDIKN